MTGDQGDLFAIQHARVTDPVTSKQAAKSMAEAAAHQKNEIYWSMVRAGIPLTAEQIAARCGLDKVQCGRRMSDLERDGRVVVVDDDGVTATGRKAQRYGLKEKQNG